MEYNWYYPHLRKKLNELMHLKSYDSEAAKCIDQILDLIEYDETIPLYTSSEYFLKDFELLMPYHFLWTHFTKFNKLKKDYLEYDPTVMDHHFTRNDLLELCYNFFKATSDKRIFEIFQKLYKERNEHLGFIRKPIHENFYADSIYFPYLNEHFIQIHPRHNFRDLATLVHEYGHIIHFIINNERIYSNKNYIYKEIISSFFEVLCLDYYSHNFEFSPKVICALADFWDEAKENADDFEYFDMLCHKMGIFNAKKKYIPKIIKNNFELNPDENEFYHAISEENYNYSNAMYLLGQMVAIELLNEFHKDPEKTFYNLYKIMQINCDLPPYEYYQELVKHGVILNNSTEIMDEEIKRKLIL